MLYELTLFQQYFDQVCINRWNYVSSGSSSAFTGAFALLNAFGGNEDQTPPVTTTTLGAVLIFQHEDVTTTGISVRAIYDVEDFIDVAYNPTIPGAIISGNGLSPATAYGLRTNRVRQDIGRGMKRFVGVSDEYIGDGGFVTGAVVGHLTNVAAVMGEVLDYTAGGDTISFTPAIVSKQKYTAPSGRDAYRYYSTLAAQMDHVALNPEWQYYAATRTQRSRQYGHGS